ncbi:hypothetical protein ABK040_001525 [Willaertia magna]
MLSDKQEHCFYGSIKRNRKKKKVSKIIVFNKLLKEGLKEEKYYFNLTLILEHYSQRDLSSYCSIIEFEKKPHIVIGCLSLINYHCQSLMRFKIINVNGRKILGIYNVNNKIVVFSENSEILIKYREKLFKDAPYLYCFECQYYCSTTTIVDNNVSTTWYYKEEDNNNNNNIDMKNNNNGNEENIDDTDNDYEPSESKHSSDYEIIY